MPATQQVYIYGGLTLDVDRHCIGSVTATTQFHTQKNHHCVVYVANTINDKSLRGFFKKFCYERLSIRQNNVCLTDLVHKYSSFYHTCTCEISKELSKYKYSDWYLKWPHSYTRAYIWIWGAAVAEWLSSWLGLRSKRTGFDSRPRHLNFQWLVISWF